MMLAALISHTVTALLSHYIDSIESQGVQYHHSVKHQWPSRGKTMITTAKKTHGKGELRTGWASWDDDQFKSRSYKWAYKDSAGKISRGSPEMPIDLYIPFMEFLFDQGEFTTPDLLKMKALIDKALK